MADGSVEHSPQRYARLAGGLYLTVIALGIFAEGYVVNTMTVSGDMTASALNIVAGATLWNLGVLANVLLVVCALPLSWFIYLLLRPAGKNLMVLALLFNLVSLAVEAISKLALILVLPILTSAGYANAFEPAQVHALANMALKVHSIAFNVALIFFGFTCIVYGHLIYSSGYLPKLLGVLMQVAGASYLLACFSILFAPALSNWINPAILVLPLIGESSLCIWLLLKGVNVEKWQEKLSLRPQERAQAGKNYCVSCVSVFTACSAWWRSLPACSATSSIRPTLSYQNYRAN